MNTSRVPAGTPTGGQFATTPRSESVVQLHPGRSTRDRVREAQEVCERLVARRCGPRDSLVPGEKFEAVEADLRLMYPNLPDDQFDAHLRKIGALAEHVSVVEAASDDHPDAYAEQALMVNVHPEDYPVEEYEYDGEVTDYAAYRLDVISELDMKLRRASAELALADMLSRAGSEDGSGPGAA